MGGNVKLAALEKTSTEVVAGYLQCTRFRRQALGVAQRDVELGQ
jgi:hypothetical protein